MGSKELVTSCCGEPALESDCTWCDGGGCEECLYAGYRGTGWECAGCYQAVEHESLVEAAA